MSFFILLVTGGRDFDDEDRVNDVLAGMQSRFPGFLTVQGGARGADKLARDWCFENGHPCATFAAAWDYYGKRAGGIRNQWMLDYLKPDAVCYFPGGAGTADMVRRAQRQGIPCYAG